MRVFEPALVISVLDGDTIKVQVQLDEDTYRLLTLRLARIDADELRDKDPDLKAKALRARDWIAERISGTMIKVVTLKPDKYGRRVAEVWYKEGGIMLNLSDQLINAGIVKQYK